MWSSKQAIKQHIEHGRYAIAKRHVVIGGVATAGILALSAVALQVAADDSNSTPSITTKKESNKAAEGKTSITSNETSLSADDSSYTETVVETDTSAAPTTPQTSPSTSVTVNDQPVPVPQNGSFHSSTVTNDGATKLDININAHTNGESSSRTSTKIDVNSSTRVSGNSTERTR